MNRSPVLLELPFDACNSFQQWIQSRILLIGRRALFRRDAAATSSRLCLLLLFFIIFLPIITATAQGIVTEYPRAVTLPFLAVRSIVCSA